ncbi:hypothetical protein GCM10029992_02750 [Glycomyces albus]
MRLTEALTELFLPAACAACREAPASGGGLCGACAAALPDRGPVLAVPGERQAPPTVVAGAYDGVLAEVLNEYKERGRRELAPALSGLLREAVAAVAEQVPGAVLVPIPATRAARASAASTTWRPCAVRSGGCGAVCGPGPDRTRWA